MAAGGMAAGGMAVGGMAVGGGYPPFPSGLVTNTSGVVYTHSSIPVDTLETGEAKAGNILYVNKNGDAVWGDPLEIESERYMDDPFLKDSYEKYRAAKAELEMRIKLQKDAENDQQKL